MARDSRRMAWWPAVLIWVVAAGVFLSAQGGLTQREVRERRVNVSVLDRTDTPIKDLSVRDFVVRENGVLREVLRVTPGAGPPDICLLVDTSSGIQDLVPELRAALKKFVGQVAAARAETRFALTTFGERPQQVADYSTGVAPLTQRIDRLFPMTNSGAYLLEALVDVSQAAKKKELAQATVVAFVAEDAPEFSNVTRDRVVEALKNAGLTLWTIVLHRRAGIDPASSEERERAMVLTDVATDSGGMSLPVLDKTGLEAAFTRVATALTSEYEVTYGRPESLIPPDRLEVSVTRPDARVAAPRWARR